jgi:hypothetical protein
MTRVVERVTQQIRVTGDIKELSFQFKDDGKEIIEGNHTQQVGSKYIGEDEVQEKEDLVSQSDLYSTWMDD